MVLEENNGKNLQDLGLGENFLGQPKHDPQKKKKINKFDPIKIKNFSSARNPLNRIKRETTHWEKEYLQAPYLMKDFRIKNSQNFKKTINLENEQKL